MKINRICCNNKKHQRRMPFRQVAILLVAIFVFISVMWSQAGCAQGGTYGPFNDMIINYGVSGANLDPDPRIIEDFTTSRIYTGQLTGSELRVSGNIQFGYDQITIHVSATVDGVSDTQEFEFPYKSGETERSTPFDVSVPIPKDANSGSFSISVSLSSPYGARTLVVSGNLSGPGSALEEKSPPIHDLPSGIDPGPDPKPGPPISPGGDGFDSVPPYDSSPAGLSKIPLPENAGQAMAGLLIPGILSIILGILGQSGAAVAPVVGSGSTKAKAGSAYDFGDGRDYYEGQSYTFDDGREYKIVDGEFVPSRDLNNGATYVDPDGNRKIWIGGQAWHEADWRRQEATSRQYKAAHDADWAVESTQLNPDLVESWDKYQHEKNLTDHLSGMQVAAVRQGMLGVYDRAEEMISQIRNGEPINYEKIGRLRNYVGGRLTGRILGPDQLPPPLEPVFTDWENWSEALTETGRNVTQGQSSDGSTSWIGIGGRIGIGIVTGGASEWVFVPTGSMYTVKDAIDRGDSGLSATLQAMGQALVQDGIGRVVGGAINAGGAAARGAYNTGMQEGLSGMARGGLGGGWASLKQTAVDQIKQVGDLFSGQAWRSTGQQLGSSIMDGSRRIGNIITGQEGYTGPSFQDIKNGVREGQNQILGSKPQLTLAEQAKLNQFNEAIRSNDPQKVAELYTNGGMKDLADLQKKGYIPPEAARQCNRLIKSQVDQSIREGTRGAIYSTQEQTQVRITEVIVGDSGSSAKGFPTRLPTDADRTLIPQVNQEDLRRYAWRKNISMEEAYNDVSRILKENHTSHVNHSLSSRGQIRMPDGTTRGLSANDVDFASYDRIGAASGQGDSYPSSFTNARQAASGTGEVYKVNPDNSIRQPYKTSGQAVVDQNQLNNATYGTSRFELDPVRLNPQDTQPVLKQQLESLFKGDHASDPQYVAKTVERWQKQATVGQFSVNKDGISDFTAAASRKSVEQMNPRLVNTARQIRNIKSDPGAIDTIVRQNGYSGIEEFLQEGTEAMRYAGELFN
jgi:hypothetical protein